MPHDGETKTWLETEHGDEILITGICSIGRAESNNIILSKGVVSRHHAVIHERDKEFWIVDLGGVNGILLNGNRVNQSALLQSGDLIQIPSADFIFYHGAASAQVPATPVSQVVPPVEPSLEVTPHAMPQHAPEEVTAPTAVTMPLPHLVKPTQQDELPLGLPSEATSQSGKLKKPRVYVGPVDSQGLPKILLTKTARPEALKLSPDVVAKPSATAQLPKTSQSEDSLKVTIPLSPPALPAKPREVTLINASDVIVQAPEKPKAPPVLPVPATVKADSFLQPSTLQTNASPTASPTKSIAPPRRTKEVTAGPEPLPAPPSVKTPAPISKITPPLTAIPATLPEDTDGFILAPPGTGEAAPASKMDRPPTPIKPEEPKAPSPIHTAPPLLAIAESKEQKKLPHKGVPVAKKMEIEAKPIAATIPLSSAGNVPPPQTVPCATARYSMYVGLASIFLPFAGLLTALAAIVMGHSALNKIKQSRGMLTGRPSAVLGLYFGYITLVLISGYSILFYFLFSSPSRTEALVHSASIPASIVLTAPSLTPTNPPPSTAETVPTPAPTNAAPADAPAMPHAEGPDLQTSTAPTPSPQSPLPDADGTMATAPEASSNPTPVPSSTSPTPPTPQTIVSDSSGGNAAALLQSNTPSPANTNAAPSSASILALASVPAPASTPAVYDPVVQNRLKDGMLAQPMPSDVSSRAYMDAESFNNCARLLARPPEAKYAESVGDFLDDVKTRNPDPARLQILSAMYENYMAGIKREP